MMTTSARRPASRACSGFEIPKPSPTGTSDVRRTVSRTAWNESETSLRSPVTPRRVTQYRNPVVTSMARRIRSGPEVGATRNTVPRPWAAAAGRNGPDSSGGTSVRRIPRTPAAAPSAAKRSQP